MSETTLCKVCGKDLATCETIIAAEGFLYCSRTCCIHDYEYSCCVNAEQHVSEVAEEITPADCGLEVTYMDRDQIMAALEQLARGQGRYQRFYNNLMDDAEYRDAMLSELEDEKFKDIVDLVLWFES